MSVEISSIVKRTGEVVPFDRLKIRNAIYKATAAVGRHDEALADRATGDVLEALRQAYSADLSPTVEEIQDVVERVLLESGHGDVAKAYIVYRHERAKMRSQPRSVHTENLPYRLMWQALDWAVEQGCHTVDGLNEIIRRGDLADLIRSADAAYEAAIEDAAAFVVERRDDLRFLVVAGPSSSGKTTTTHKLAAHLESAGIHVVPLALDNYFFDLDLHPGDALGDRDFETPEALDLNLINEHLAALDAGRAIDVPVYDFKSGRRLAAATTRFEAEPDSVILLDTLHGLYDELGSSVAESHKFRLYVETISQLKDAEGRYVRWADIRLLRRMIRDVLHRGYEPERTLLHWHYVRRSELKHIIPHQGRADWHVNTSLAYELPYLKLHLFDRLPGYLEAWREDESRLDGFLRARRVHNLLDSISDVGDDSLVPPTSLLREFIGGSAYDLH